MFRCNRGSLLESSFMVPCHICIIPRDNSLISNCPRFFYKWRMNPFAPYVTGSSFRKAGWGCGDDTCIHTSSWIFFTVSWFSQVLEYYDDLPPKINTYVVLHQCLHSLSRSPISDNDRGEESPVFRLFGLLARACSLHCSARFSWETNQSSVPRKPALLPTERAFLLTGQPGRRWVKNSW